MVIYDFRKFGIVYHTFIFGNENPTLGFSPELLGILCLFAINKEIVKSQSSPEVYQQVEQIVLQSKRFGENCVSYIDNTGIKTSISLEFLCEDQETWLFTMPLTQRTANDTLEGIKTETTVVQAHEIKKAFQIKEHQCDSLDLESTKLTSVDLFYGFITEELYNIINESFNHNRYIWERTLSKILIETAIGLYEIKLSSSMGISTESQALTLRHQSSKEEIYKEAIQRNIYAPEQDLIFNYAEHKAKEVLGTNHQTDILDKNKRYKDLASYIKKFFLKNSYIQELHTQLGKREPINQREYSRYLAKKLYPETELNLKEIYYLYENFKDTVTRFEIDNRNKKILEILGLLCLRYHHGSEVVYLGQSLSLESTALYRYNAISLYFNSEKHQKKTKAMLDKLRVFYKEFGERGDETGLFRWLKIESVHNAAVVEFEYDLDKEQTNKNLLYIGDIVNEVRPNCSLELHIDLYDASSLHKQTLTTINDVALWRAWQGIKKTQGGFFCISSEKTTRDNLYKFITALYVMFEKVYVFFVSENNCLFIYYYQPYKNLDKQGFLAHFKKQSQLNWDYLEFNEQYESVVLDIFLNICQLSHLETIEKNNILAQQVNRQNMENISVIDTAIFSPMKNDENKSEQSTPISETEKNTRTLSELQESALAVDEKNTEQNTEDNAETENTWDDLMIFADEINEQDESDLPPSLEDDEISEVDLDDDFDDSFFDNILVDD